MPHITEQRAPFVESLHTPPNKQARFSRQRCDTVHSKTVWSITQAPEGEALNVAGQARPRGACPLSQPNPPR